MKDMGPTRRSSAQLVQFVLRGDLLNVRPGRGLFTVITDRQMLKLRAGRVDWME